MPEPHPMTLWEPDALDAKLREILGISDDETVPQIYYDKMDKIINRPYDQVTEDMRLGNISQRFRNAGIPDADNPARNMLRDQSVQDYNLSVIEGLTPARGAWAEAGGIWHNTLVTGTKRLGLAISQSWLKAWEFYAGEGELATNIKLGVRHRLGVDLDNVWSPTGRKEDAVGWNIDSFDKLGLPLYKGIGQLERAYGEGTVSKVVDVLFEGTMEADEYLMGLQAQHERDMMGKVSAWRSGGRLVHETAAGISQFVIAGTASSLLTGTPLPLSLIHI